MSTDRELLEMAAKAADLDLVWDGPPSHCDVPRHRGVTGNSPRIWWNPLDEDGDALRLAVKLKLLIDMDDGGAYVAGEEPSLREEYGADPYAATRRAIVRAAAALGRAMP